MSEFDPQDDYERLFDQSYMRWFHLEGKPALVEVVKIERLDLKLRGGGNKKSPVFTIKQIKGSIASVRPLVMNRTNMDKMAELFGRKPKEWVGKQFVMYQDTTKLKGDTVPCIRIRAPKPAAAKPKSDPKPNTKEPESTPKDPDIPF